ncbi:hypothetical protein JXA40_08125 [bacterium]|nr:hypothetical protein [candidate division CSSED10-310 bacterium]
MQDLIWIVVFLAFRFWTLLSIGSDIVFTEEIYNGRIGYEIMKHGLRFGRDMQFLPFAGGTYVTGLMAAGTFALFGLNLFALKMIPLLFFTGAFWIWRIYLRRYFSLTSANAMSLLLLFPPPFLNKIATVAWGNHLESTFLIATGLFLVASTLNADRPVFRALILGLWSGLSLYFIPSYLLFLAAAGIFLAGKSLKYRFRLPWIALSLGFLIGLVPWMMVNILWQFKGLRIFGRFGHLPVDFLDRVGKFWWIHVPKSTGFMFGHDSGVWIAGMVYWIIALMVFLGVFIPSIRLKAYSGSGIIWIYILLFAPAFAASSFDFKPVGPPAEFRTYRYLAPLYPMLLACVSLGVGGWIASGRKSIKVVGIMLLSLMVAAGLAGTIRLWEPPSGWMGVFNTQDYSGIGDFRELKEFK